MAKEFIENYNEKKVVDYLEDGQKVLLRFGHGLGDCLLFMPVFWHLKELYPKVHFDLYLESGQEEIFNSVPVGEGDEYDLIFTLHFPMSEGTDLTKSQKCCVDELGIEPITEVAQLPQKRSPIVAVHFHGTALPNAVGCPEPIAKQIWADIIKAGKIPMECHFEHMFHNPANAKYPFVTNTCRGCEPNLHSLIGLLQHSFAFIGVASGPFVVGLSTMPQRMLYLEKAHKLTSYTRYPVPTIDIKKDYTEGYVYQWLKWLEAHK